MKTMAGARFTRLFEQVADTRRPDADEHFDEFRTGNGKKRHARFTGDCAGQ